MVMKLSTIHPHREWRAIKQSEYVYFDDNLWQAIVRRQEPSWLYWEIDIRSRENTQQFFKLVAHSEPKTTSLRNAMNRALALLALERTT